MIDQDIPAPVRGELLTDHSGKAGAVPALSQPKGDRIGRWVQHAWSLSALPLLLLFVVPVAILFVRTSPEMLIASLGQTMVVQAVYLSLRTTLASLLITVILGTPLAYLLGRRQFRFKRVLETLVDLPTVLPPTVAGFALLLALGRRGVIGGWLEAWGIHIAFTQSAVVIAQTFISAPFYVRSAALGFASIDSEYEQAAQLDGASRWQLFRFVILPLSQLALISGAVMSWSRALGEFGATILFAGNFPGRTQTMPLAIYLGFEVNPDFALTLSVILVAISFLSLLMVKSLVAWKTE